MHQAVSKCKKIDSRRLSDRDQRRSESGNHAPHQEQAVIMDLTKNSHKVAYKLDPWSTTTSLRISSLVVNHMISPSSRGIGRLRKQTRPPILPFLDNFHDDLTIVSFLYPLSGSGATARYAVQGNLVRSWDGCHQR